MPPTENFKESPEPNSEEQYRQRLVLNLPLPFVDDTGNGLRLHDIKGFLESEYAPPPSLDDPECAKYADKAVCEALKRVLPEEVALVRILTLLLWC